MNPLLPSFGNESENQAQTPEHQAREGIVDRSIEDIDVLQTDIAESLNVPVNSVEATHATDQELIRIAEVNVETPGVMLEQEQAAFNNAAVESALEMDNGFTIQDTPIAALELDGYGGSINDVVARLSESHQTLPSGHEAAPILMAGIDSLTSQLPDNSEAEGLRFVDKQETNAEKNEALIAKGDVKDWDQADDGSLEMTMLAKVLLSEKARHVLETNAYESDETLRQLVAEKQEALATEADAKKAVLQQQLDGLAARRAQMDPQTTAGIDGVIGQLTRNLESVTPNNQELLSVVTAALEEREKNDVEAAIAERREQGARPWTMPESQVEIPAEQMEWFQIGYDDIMHQERTPSPDDVYTLHVRMGAEGGFAAKDVELLACAGIAEADMKKVKREDLQRAGVFFVNKIGEGEQAILGSPIPDPDSPGGVFNPGERTVLTKEEFEKVYTYQQEHGYGINGADPEDVQMDMVVFGMRQEAVERGLNKTVGPGSRVDKYNAVYSPFVDSGHMAPHGRGLEGFIYFDENDQDRFSSKSKRRMNDITVYLVNAHPEYPGLSEMFEEDAAHDQRYLSAGEYMQVYQKPTTDQEAFSALKYGGMTPREREWVGKLKNNFYDTEQTTDSLGNPLTKAV